MKKLFSFFERLMRFLALLIGVAAIHIRLLQHPYGVDCNGNPCACHLLYVVASYDHRFGLRHSIDYKYRLINDAAGANKAPAASLVISVNDGICLCIRLRALRASLSSCTCP